MSNRLKDAVCKMELDEAHVKEILLYKGARYYFCSVGCRAEFERHPEDYTQTVQTRDGVDGNV